MSLQKLGTVYKTASPSRNPYSAGGSNHGPSGGTSGAVVEKHVDVDALLEDYAWKYFDDMRSLKGSGMEQFKGLRKEEVDFVINRKRLVLTHEEPAYSNVQQTGIRPNTVFKSVFTNSTSQAQSYSLKTERTSESICGVVREQGFMFGAEAELTLKTPCEIAELKTGFKHEVHFNSLTENTKSEVLSWSVDSNIIVNSGSQTEASIVIEELSYHGTYHLVSTLFGMITISIKRAKDGVLVIPVTANIATIFQEYLNKNDPRLRGVATVKSNKVELTSKGHCHFQFAMKQYVDLKDVHMDLVSQTNRLNMASRGPGYR
ncbi:hypothetical protein FO519_001434 [Halicephalobus sp. NKZ332]|nr:hypothetical protein FO519_001434 [Halicephalobus sp. NKZ332]